VADAETGQQLRDFFLGLLQGTNLQEYYKDRNAYIARRFEQKQIGSEARRVLEEGTLAEIEENVKLVYGSGFAWPVVVVWPPF
jgi:hypothetical protein